MSVKSHLGLLDIIVYSAKRMSFVVWVTEERSVSCVSAALCELSLVILPHEIDQFSRSFLPAAKHL